MMMPFNILDEVCQKIMELRELRRLHLEAG